MFMLLIFDGIGYRSGEEGNALNAANMPTFRFVTNKYPHCLLNASGRSVGLPDGFMGNSQVGHLALGSGRVIETPLCRFHDSIDDGSFFDNKMLISKFEKLKKENKTLHVIGLLSDAGVHSHEKHLYAILGMARDVGLDKVFVHPFLDGRDTLPKSAESHLEKLDKFCT